VYYSESGTLPTPAPAGSTAGVNISGTTATITGLTSGKLYYVWVRAINDAGIGEYSTRGSGTPEYSLSMGANTATVTGIAASLEVVWTAVDGATGYDVYYNTANTAPTETTNGSGNVTITGTVATITGLGNGTTYYVWVRAKNASTTGAWAAQSSGTPEAVVIPADLGQYFQSLPYQGLAALAYYDDGFVVDVNAKTFYNYSDSTFNMKWGGTIIKIVPEGDASIMIVKIETVTGNWPTPPEVGKYFAAAYKNLLPWGNGIFAVNSNAAYKEIGGNNAGTATITEAVSEYTVANGYYNSLSTTMYYSHTTSATTLAPLQGNWEWDSYEDYLIQIRGTKLTEWFDDDSDGTYDSYTEKDSLGELGDIVDSTNTSQTSGILYVKIIDSTVFSADKYIAVAWKNLTDSSVSFLTTGGAGNAGYATLTEVKTALNDLSNDSQFPAASFLDFDLK
jgi:hypothetical protein